MQAYEKRENGALVLIHDGFGENAEKQKYLLYEHPLLSAAGIIVYGQAPCVIATAKFRGITSEYENMESVMKRTYSVEEMCAALDKEVVRIGMD